MKVESFYWPRRDRSDQGMENIGVARLMLDKFDSENVPDLTGLLVQNRATLPANICWSPRRLQHVFSVTILRLPRRLEDILKTFFKTSWKTKNCYAEDVLKT